VTVIMVRINHYGSKQFLTGTVERGKCVLYVQLNKALYGTLQAALLFWRLLSSKLKEWGFIINPYNWCIANKMVDDKQCTMAWHVDDLKISHVS